GVARLRDDRLDDGGLLLAPAPRLPPAPAGDQLGEIALRRVAIPHRDARHHVARRGPLGGQPGSRGRPARGIRAGLARGLAILRRASLLLDFSAGRRRRGRRGDRGRDRSRRGLGARGGLLTRPLRLRLGRRGLGGAPARRRTGTVLLLLSSD